MPSRDTRGGVPHFSSIWRLSVVSRSLAASSVSERIMWVSCIAFLAASVRAQSVHISFILSNSKLISVLFISLFSWFLFRMPTSCASSGSGCPHTVSGSAPLRASVLQQSFPSLSHELALL